jgi:hypothetical protein
VFGWLKKTLGGARETDAPPIPQGPLSEAALKQALGRPCAPLVFRKPATIDPVATMFGTVRLAGREEKWPICEGAPLWPLVQINMSTAPFVPEPLRDLALITVFISPAHAQAPTRIIDTANPDPAATWVLRSYATLDGLKILQAPRHGSALIPQIGEWTEVRPDYANQDLAWQVVDTEENDVSDHGWYRSVQQTKLGGWPATVRSAPWWSTEKSKDTWDYVLQIENEPKAGWTGWGDGAAFIARSRTRPHLWAIDVQFT